MNFGKTSKYTRTVHILQRIIISERIEIQKMRAIPVGGDQLTYESLRGAHFARLDDDSQEKRLEGLITIVEDFHEKMNFLQVMY